MSNNLGGLSKTNLYKVYRSMINRCYKEYDKFYSDYGGRGIKVCPEWLGENGFINFYNWAMVNGYKEGLSLERKDVNGNYCTENCTFITMAEQQRNKRNNVHVFYKGKDMLLVDVAKEIGVYPSAISQRISKGKDSTSPKIGHEKKVIRDDGRIYMSVREAGRMNRVGESKISMVCNGKRKKTAGHSFAFLTESEAEEALKRMNEMEGENG